MVVPVVGNKMRHWIIANWKLGAHAVNLTQGLTKGKMLRRYPKYSNYSHWCGRKRQRATCPQIQMAFDNGFLFSRQAKRHC